MRASPLTYSTLMAPMFPGFFSPLSLRLTSLSTRIRAILETGSVRGLGAARGTTLTPSDPTTFLKTITTATGKTPTPPPAALATSPLLASSPPCPTPVPKPMPIFVMGMMILSAFAGCANFEQPAHFAVDEYPGGTRLERVLAKINLEQNRFPSCGRDSICQSGLPTREEVTTAVRFDCKAYVMSKAYALQDAGIDASRMRVAQMDFARASHVVLVVDERYVLDNLDSTVRPISEFARFQPVLAELPANLMARDSESRRTVSLDALEPERVWPMR